MSELKLKGVKFIDLFSGIGAFHLALSKHGAECVYASEWDKYAKKTYYENFNIEPEGDITKISEDSIPDHDILCAGFPCQAFSISGKQTGFDDARGTLFFEVARIVNKKRPKIVFMENVRNFEKHDNGKTIQVVANTLYELGYNFNYEILDASDFGLPQSRKRIYMVAIRKDLNINDFAFPIGFKSSVCLNDILMKDEDTNEFIIERQDTFLDFEKIKKIEEEKHVYLKPIRVGTINKGGQGERIYSPWGHSITLSAYGGGPGSKTGCYYINGRVRKLSPRECARIQGFSDDYVIPVSNAQAWKQFGNSIPVNVLDEIVNEFIKNENLLNSIRNKKKSV